MLTTLQSWARSRTVRVALAVGLLAAAADALPASAQNPATGSRPEYTQLKARAEQRFQVLVTRQSLVLVPKTPIKGLTNIELSDGLVLIDGNAVTGKELRAVLGADTETVIQLSFLDAAVRRQLFEAARPAPAAPAAPAAREEAAEPSTKAEPDTGITITDEWGSRRRPRGAGARVRIGGTVRVDEGESIANDVVAILGAAVIDGSVNGEVVAVGGDVRLGPKALVKGSVTSVGGAIERAAGSRIEGEINEVRLTLPAVRPYAHFVAPWRNWTWFSSPFSSTIQLAGTLVRVAIIGLLAVMLVALMPGKVQGVSDRIAAEPWRAAFTGLAAQVLFVPALVLTSTVLLVSIVGIPLLLLMPFVIIAVMVAALVGFTGVGYAIGERFGHRGDRSFGGLVAPLLIGLAVIWALTVLARVVGLAGGPVSYIVGGVLIVGFVIEYVAWTVGLGGVLLNRFGRRKPATIFDEPPLERESAPPAGEGPVAGL